MTRFRSLGTKINILGQDTDWKTLTDEKKQKIFDGDVDSFYRPGLELYRLRARFRILMTTRAGYWQTRFLLRRQRPRAVKNTSIIIQLP